MNGLKMNRENVRRLVLLVFFSLKIYYKLINLYLVGVREEFIFFWLRNLFFFGWCKDGMNFMN